MSVCMSVYLEQPPACVEIFDAFQVARRQLYVGRAESGRQLVHVRYVILNGSNLFLELLQHIHNHTQTHTQGVCYAALFTVMRGQMGNTDRLLVALGSVLFLTSTVTNRCIHHVNPTFPACLMRADVWKTLTCLSRINAT